MQYANVTNKTGRTQPEKGDKWLWVDFAEIKKNSYDLSISRYKPIEYEEIAYEKPGDIITKLKNLEDQLSSDIDVISRTLE